MSIGCFQFSFMLCDFSLKELITECNIRGTFVQTAPVVGKGGKKPWISHHKSVLFPAPLPLRGWLWTTRFTSLGLSFPSHKTEVFDQNIPKVFPNLSPSMIFHHLCWLLEPLLGSNTIHVSVWLAGFALQRRRYWPSRAQRLRCSTEWVASGLSCQS